MKKPERKGRKGIAKDAKNILDFFLLAPFAFSLRPLRSAVWI
jgi:hypothetical protein